jgi:hypothetical protein
MGVSLPQKTNGTISRQARSEESFQICHRKTKSYMVVGGWGGSLDLLLLSVGKKKTSYLGMMQGQPGQRHET